jgi:hypothetical protein
MLREYFIAPNAGTAGPVLSSTPGNKPKPNCVLEIEAGAVRAYYLFDVADTIDLSIATLEREGVALAEFPLR